MTDEEKQKEKDEEKEFKDKGFEPQRKDGVKTETANQTSSSITITVSERPTSGTTVKNCEVKDLKPDDAISINFDAPEETEKKKDTEVFFGALNSTTGNLTTDGIYVDKKTGTKKTTHLT